MTQTIPLLFAGADCSFMDFGGVRALVVLPELPVAGGAVGGVAASLGLEELDDCRALPVDSLVVPVRSFVRALVVLPEFAPAVGFVELPAAEVEVVAGSFELVFDFLLLDVPVLLSPATGVSPVGGVALAEGSGAALFFGLLVAVAVVFALLPSAFPALSLLVLDLLLEEVAEAPELLAVLSVPAVWFESVFFLALVFFEVVEVSPELASEDLVESVESAAGFFFFFFAAVESLCDWSVDCVDWRAALPCDVLTRPKPSNDAAKTAINIVKRTFFFIAPLLNIAVVRLTTRQDVLNKDVSQYRRERSRVGNYVLARGKLWRDEGTFERVLVARCLHPRRFHRLSQPAAHGTQRKGRHFQFRLNGKIRSFTREFAAAIQLQPRLAQKFR